MKFDYTSHGCAKAITYLYSINEMSDGILRRDGWEIVGYAIKLWKKNNEDSVEDMDVGSG